MGWSFDDVTIEYDTLVEFGGVLQRHKAYPYLDIAHYALTCVAIRRELGEYDKVFSRSHPFATWLSSIVLCFSGSFLASFLLGEPIITPLRRHDDVLLASIVWYFVFYSPFDIIYNIINNKLVKLILCLCNEALRAQKISNGVKYTAKLYPESYIVQVLVGISKGAGSGIVKIFEQIIRGTWSPSYHEILRPSFTTKACTVASIIFTLERHSMYIKAPHDLVYLCIVAAFSYFKITDMVLGITDVLVPFENFICAMFMGGIFDALARAINSTKLSIRKENNQEKPSFADRKKYKKKIN